MPAFKRWFQKYFVATEFGSLCLFLIILVCAFWWLSNLVIPVLVSIIIAYLLDHIVEILVRLKISNRLAVHLVFLLFLGLLIFSLLILLPLLWDQLSLLFNDLPIKIKKLEVYFTQLSLQYPNYISKIQIQNWIHAFQANFSQIGKSILAYSVSTVSKIMMLVVYLVLVPLMVYFFMKDKRIILNWLSCLLPKKRQLLREVWHEIDQQMGRYISAKVLEIIIVAISATIAFLLLGLNYPVLLGVLVGISALIPYVGVILVTIPVVVVGYLQWGFTMPFLYLNLVYLILMIVDGNVLTPLLFSETMNLHPVAVIIAILIFGGLWGFWGIFFAIPLASVIQVLLNAWLSQTH